MKKVAVIILNWNGERMLRQFLGSVVKNTPAELARIVLADNGSTDGSISYVTSSFPQVDIILFDKNYGYAEGYNRAIAQTSEPFSVLLNSDVEVSAGWLEPLLSAMESDDSLGAAQPKIRSYNEPAKFEYAGACGGFIDRNGYPYCRGRIFATTETDSGQYNEPIKIFWATGAALMVRTRLYEEVGGLDPLFFAHMEEIDLCWRMALKGWGIEVIPKSIVYHLGGGCLPPSDPRKTYLNYRNNLLLLHKNLPPQDLRSTLLRRRLLDTLAWAQYLLKFQWGNARAVVKAHRHFRKMRKNYTSHPQRNLLRSYPMCRQNIITSYYLRGHKFFSQLKPRQTLCSR